jgi:hypothetical protein
MPPKEIFGAREHLDKEEGKGRIEVVGWFTTREAAEKFSAEIPGVFGTPNDLPVAESTLYESAEEHPDYDADKAATRIRIEELKAELSHLRSKLKE